MAVPLDSGPDFKEGLVRKRLVKVTPLLKGLHCFQVLSPVVHHVLFVFWGVLQSNQLLLLVAEITFFFCKVVLALFSWSSHHLFNLTFSYGIVKRFSFLVLSLNFDFSTSFFLKYVFFVFTLATVKIVSHVACRVFKVYRTKSFTLKFRSPFFYLNFCL